MCAMATGAARRRLRANGIAARCARMQAQDWKHAAYCAGVMSHYVVDPVQPFHTHQTEEEGTIHRAVEWSLSKAFPEMLLILTQDLGFPDVPVPEGDDWLEQMVKAGALVSNRHYETLIDHYDFAVGVKRPVEGLDQEMKDVVAALMGYATVMLSRILDRAIAEAKAEAPHVSLVLDTVGIVANTPVRMVAKRIAHVAEAELVSSQYKEYPQDRQGARDAGRRRQGRPQDVCRGSAEGLAVDAGLPVAARDRARRPGRAPTRA